MGASTWIKICGVTLPAGIEAVVAGGAQAVGLNFVQWSKRRVEVAVARELVRVARRQIEVIGVVSDLQDDKIRELVSFVGLDRVQLHGNEDHAQLERLGSLVFKAVGIASREDVARAVLFPGAPLLVDAAVGQQSGGTGTTFNWSLVSEVCRTRPVVVAGGLHPENVAEAVAFLRPFGVDVASGVEPKGCPGIKDEKLVKQFVAAVRHADSQR